MSIDIRKEKVDRLFLFCKKCWNYKEFKFDPDYSKKIIKVECKTCGNLQNVDTKYIEEFYLDLNKENS